MTTELDSTSGKPDVIGLGVFADASQLSASEGDLIEINHTLYSDWALSDGQGYVIALTGTDGEEIPSEEWAVVRRVPLSDMSGLALRVNNREVKAKERGLAPLQVDRSLRAARSLLGRKVRYNLLTRNSEHYTTEWKYGQGWSDQASLAIGVMRSLSPEHGHRDLRHTLTSVLHSPKVANRNAANKRAIAS